jgi:hypothetical protein
MVQLRNLICILMGWLMRPPSHTVSCTFSLSRTAAATHVLYVHGRQAFNLHILHSKIAQWGPEAQKPQFHKRRLVSDLIMSKRCRQVVSVLTIILLSFAYKFSLQVFESGCILATHWSNRTTKLTSEQSNGIKKCFLDNAAGLR